MRTDPVDDNVSAADAVVLAGPEVLSTVTLCPLNRSGPWYVPGSTWMTSPSRDSMMAVCIEA